MTTALQVTETAARWDDAYGILACQRTQVGYLGGRMYWRDGTWHVQAFHGAEGLQVGAWMPDGMRIVLVPDAMMARMVG